METVIEKLACFASGTKYTDLPTEVTRCAKERLIDFLSAAIAGSTLWEYNHPIIQTACDMEFLGDSVIVGKEQTVSFPAAASINCAYAHSVELDDGHKNAGIHAGAVVVPTALALAEKFGQDGENVLTAITVGYDVAYRFAESMSPILLEKGLHPSSICGTMGAAAAASNILGFDLEQTERALSLSALFTSGLMEITHSGQSSKGVMVGHAAFAGINAAMLSKNGFVAPTHSFSGSKGLFYVMSDNSVNLALLTDAIGKQFKILDTYVKLYPSCRHTHAPIEGVAALCADNNINIDDIERIDIGTHKVAYDLTGRNNFPHDAQEAKFSTSYCVACALQSGTFSVCDLQDDHIQDEKRRQLCSLVHVFVDDQVDAEFPQKRGAKIQIFLKNGTCYEKTLYQLKGAPGLPISYNDLCEKFNNMASEVISAEQRFLICDLVSKFEKQKNIKEFMELLQNASC